MGKRTGQQPFAHRRFVLARRPAVKPFVEIENERFLDEAQLDQPGSDEEIDHLSGTWDCGYECDRARIRCVGARATSMIWVGGVIARREHAAGLVELRLSAKEAELIRRMV